MLDNKNTQDPNYIQPSSPLGLGAIESAEAAQARALQQAIPVDAGEFLQSIYEEDWMLSWALQGKTEFAPDPNYQLTQDQFDELVQDIPEEYHDFVDDTVSLAHAQDVRQKVLRSVDNEKKLASWGWSGVPLRIAMNALDPGAILVTAATEGVAAPLIWGNKATRLGRAIRSAAGAGASNAAIEAYISAHSETRDAYDILYATTAGIILGGGMGAVSRVGNEAEIDAALENLSKAAQDASEAEAVLKFKEVFGVEDGPPSAGAAVNQFEPPQQVINMRSDTDAVAEALGDTEGAFMGNFRIDMAAYLLNSDNHLVKFLGKELQEDSVGARKGRKTTVEDSADLLKINNMKRKFVSFYSIYGKAYKDWAKESNVGFFARQKNNNRQTFGELVADAIERPEGQYPEPVVRAARRQAQIFKELVEEARAAGVTGFENIPSDLRYFTHRWNKGRFAQANTAYGGANIRKLLTQGLVKGSADLDEEAASLIANAMHRKITESAQGMDSGFQRIFTADSRDVLRQIVEEEELMEPGQLDRLLDLFEGRPENVPARARRRLVFDMEHSEQFFNDRTRQWEVLSVNDLTERDAEQVFTSYVSEMTGRIALAQKGIKSDTDFNALMQRAKDYAANEGTAEVRDKNVARIEKEELVARTLYNMIIGRRAPLAGDPNSTVMKIDLLFMDYNFIRLMNQVGFAQMAELGNAVQIGGIKGILQAVPEFKGMLKRARNGELEDDVLAEIEAATGIGGDRMINYSINREQDFGLFPEASDRRLSDRVINRINSVMMPLKRGTADISGMAPITLALERMAARVAVQTLTDAAFGIRKLGQGLTKAGTEAATRRRLQSLGLSDEMAEKVFRNIRDHSDTVNSTLFRNKKIKRINMEKWDQDAQDAFTVAISRWTRRSIQQNDVGSLALFMTRPMGQMISQFRTFMIVSYGKQLLHNIAMNDAKAYYAMMMSSLVASMSYAAQTQVRSIGMSEKERKKYLEERLTVKELAKAGFARSSWATFFPTLIDTPISFFDDPVFAYRTTGLATNAVQGIPAIDLLFGGFDDFQRFTRTAFDEDKRVTQGQVKALASLAPFQNALGIQNMLNAALEDFPTRSR